MKIKLIVLAALALACAGCASPNSGQYYVPAYLPQITKVNVPQQTVASGTTVTLSVEWIQGREPFVVTWFIGDDEEGQSFPVATRSHSFELTAVNEGTEDTTTLGSVEVKDAGGNPVTQQFSFTIAPAI
jgi:hypothetical protein